ncbi:hypothetical protein [Streptomyces sp. NPDC005953]|uniref:hypothetical protein n=1 Tax=Streptomyces sp. NPDC005953 TaxID=3156719 RepID=UPI0033EF432B
MTFAPRTWSVGETVTAAMLNTEVRDQFNSMFAAWTAYTPAWSSAGTAPVIGNGSITGRYMKVGRTCHVAIRHVCGSSTTYGSGGYLWSLPFTSANAGVEYLGSARLTGTDAWLGQTVVSANSGLISPTFPASATNTRSATQTASVPEVLANGSIIRMSITYQTST